MTNSILKKLLTTLPIFRHLTDDELRILAFIGKRSEHASGDVLYEADSLSEGAILISAGRAAVQPQDSQKPYMWVRRGMMINEMSLFSEKIYEHDVVAMEQVTAYHFGREDIMHLMQEFPEINYKIQDNIIERLEQFSHAF